MILNALQLLLCNFYYCRRNKFIWQIRRKEGKGTSLDNFQQVLTINGKTFYLMMMMFDDDQRRGEIAVQKLRCHYKKDRLSKMRSKQQQQLNWNKAPTTTLSDNKLTYHLVECAAALKAQMRPVCGDAVYYILKVAPWNKWSEITLRIYCAPSIIESVPHNWSERFSKVK